MLVTVKHATKSPNPTLDTYFKWHIKVYLAALKVIKGEGALQYWPFPEICWRKPTTPCAVPEMPKHVQPSSLHGVGNRTIIRTVRERNNKRQSDTFLKKKVQAFPKVFVQNIWKCLEAVLENLLWDEWRIPKRAPTTRRAQIRYSFQTPRVCGRKWSDVCSFYTCRLGSTLTYWPGISCFIYANVYKEI